MTRCLTKGSFKSGEDATVGVDFVSRIVRVGSDRVKLHLWDTAGQERFRSVTIPSSDQCHMCSQVPVPVLLPQQCGGGGGILPAVPDQLDNGGHLGH